MKFCASAGGGDELEHAFAAVSIHEKPPATSSLASNLPTNSNVKRPALTERSSENDADNDLGSILIAMRKLREGILGCRRRDSFAQRAYIFIIHASILSRSWESYHPALLYLIDQIHPDTPLSVPELQEFVGYRVLDLACRQYDLAEAFSVTRAFNYRDRRINIILQSLVHDDWVRFWRMKRAVDGYRRSIMESAVERMRLHALKCLGRSYMNADKPFVERTADTGWDDLAKTGVGWQLQENGNVIIRKPKAK